MTRLLLLVPLLLLMACKPDAVPEYSQVPIPSSKPVTPAQVAEVKRWLEEAEDYFEKIEDEERLAVLSGQSGVAMCPTFAQIPVRHPRLGVIVDFKWIAKGMKPCHLLEAGSPSWYLNGKDI